jgi:hypothetical protein
LKRLTKRQVANFALLAGNLIPIAPKVELPFNRVIASEHGCASATMKQSLRFKVANFALLAHNSRTQNTLYYLKP